MSKLLKNIIYVSCGWMFNFLGMFVVGVIVARYLGTEGKGQVALSLSTGSLLGTLLCIGFDKATPYFIASKKIDAQEVLGSWLITFFISVFCAYVIIYPLFICFLMDSIFNGIERKMLLLGSIVCPVYILRSIVNSIAAGKEEFGKQTKHNLIIHICGFLSAVIGIIILQLKVNGYLFTRIIFLFITLVFGFCILSKIISLRPEFCFKAWMKMFRYGLKAFLSQVFNLIDLRFDIYVVNYFVGTSLVGVYTVAGSLSVLFWIIPSSIVSVLLPRVAATTSQQSSKITAFLCRHSLWQAIILGSIFLIFSKQLIFFIYGPEFFDASIAIMFLMPGVLGQVVSKVCYTDCCGRGAPEKATIGVGVTAAITVILDFILIPHYGIYGAAIASSIAYITGGILAIRWHLILSKNKLSDLLVPTFNDIVLYKSNIIKIKKKFIK